ncbi:MAG: fused MFS/spermidine synthase [Desulfobacterales bacterium]|nr:MAG: fused MFS/spermidine synthase [Desulfobacterales bacterium]
MQNTEMPVAVTDRIYGIILGLFFLSGISALTYQVIWVKMATLVFGVAPFAVSTVLSSFMAGLTIGSLCFGRIADRTVRLLAVFGFIQIGIGAFALIFPTLLLKLTHSYAYLYLHFHTEFYLFSLLRFFIVFLLLLIPTFLMGGTLPVLSKYLIGDLRILERRIGVLYSVNNLGAAAGCFVTGLFLIRLIGLSHGVYLAACINLAIGVVSLILQRRIGSDREPTNKKKATKRKHAPDSGVSAGIADYSRRLRMLVAVVFGISGFASLVYEVVWTRMLSALLLSNSVYSFSMVVITFIAGIGLGSLVYAKFMDHIRDKLTVFGLTQLAIGVTVVVLLPLFFHMPVLIGQVSPWLFGRSPSWSMCVASEFLVGFLLMIVPTTLMGATFPLVAKIYTGNLDRLGSRIGEVSSLDTVGPVLGAFAGGFVFIPLLGMQNSILILALINICMGIVVLYANPQLAHRTRWILISVLVFVAVLARGVIRSENIFWREGRVLGEKLSYYNEDAAATVVVREYPQGTGLNRIMEVDGTDVAGTDYMLKSTQKLQGHLPLLLHGRPRNVLIVGLGSGGTTWAVSRHDVATIQVVELVPSVAEAAARYFGEVNHGVLNDPRVRLAIGDGRNYVLTTSEVYDVILTESVHPIYAGNGNLYSFEYFRLCRERLEENGIMSVWIPLWALPEKEFRMIIRTFLEVFPHATLWYVSNSFNRQAYLIGTKAPFEIDFRSFERRTFDRDVRKDLSEVGLDDPYLLLSSFMLDEKGLADYAKDAPINSDNYPRLEYFDYPYLEFFPSESFHIKTVVENLAAMLSYRQDPATYLVNFGENVPDRNGTKDRLKVYWESSQHVLRGIIHALDGQIREAIQDYGKAFETNPHDKSAKYLLVQSLERFYVTKGDELQLEGDLQNAISSYRKALEVKPDSTNALYNLAFAYIRKGMPDEARQALSEALELNPNMENARRLLERLATPSD